MAAAISRAAEDQSRKGPWTEQEDLQLALCVNVYGERRWDFVAKVSGLKRTGKSCRLRWVNYLHPGLKRGKMTPHEERLVLELHSKLGNRWSRIARKLPGRTDNEIKNYWRTHMRKQAQERKKGRLAAASATPSSSTTSTTKTTTTTTSMASPLDEIWKDMDFFGDEPIKPVHNDYGYGGTEAGAPSMMASSVWDGYYTVPLWTMDEEAEDISTKFPPISDQFYTMSSAIARW